MILLHIVVRILLAKRENLSNSSDLEGIEQFNPFKSFNANQMHR